MTESVENKSVEVTNSSIEAGRVSIEFIILEDIREPKEDSPSNIYSRLSTSTTSLPSPYSLISTTALSTYTPPEIAFIYYPSLLSYSHSLATAYLHIPPLTRPGYVFAIAQLLGDLSSLDDFPPLFSFSLGVDPFYRELPSLQLPMLTEKGGEFLISGFSNGGRYAIYLLPTDGLFFYGVGGDEGKNIALLILDTTQTIID